MGIFSNLFNNKVVEVPKPVAKKNHATYDYVNGTGYRRDLPYAPKPLADFNSVLDKTTREDVAAIARRIYTNSGEVRHLVLSLANLATNDAFLPQFEGKDKEWAVKFAEPFWFIWTGVCDVTNKFTFNQMLNMASICLDVDGDCFIIMTENEAGMPLLQLIRSHRCKNRNSDADKNRTIVDGVVLDDIGRPVAYQFEDNNGFSEIPTSNVIHLFRAESPDQIRGVSSLIHAIDSIQRLLVIRNYEQVALQLCSSLGIIKRTESGTAEENVDFDEADQNKQTLGTISNLTLENFASGGVQYIGTNEEFTGITNNVRPSDQWQRFTDTMVNSACIGMRYPYGLLKSGVLGGAEVRMQLALLDRTVRERQDTLSQAATRIWTWVMAKRIKAGKLTKPSDGDFYSIRWSTGRRLSVDVGRDSVAEINSLRAGTTTYKEIYNSRGLDENDMLEQRAKEAAKINELAKKYSVSPAEIAQMNPNESRQTEPSNNGNNNNE